MYGGDEVGALVLDVGTGTTRAGYAGEDTPKAVFPSEVGFVFAPERDNVVGEKRKAVGETESTDAEPSKPAPKGKYYVGTEALWPRHDNEEIKYPLQGGLVNDWEALEHVWDHALYERLRSDPKEHPILLAESSFNTRAIRERMTEIFFEKYSTPALFLAKNAVLTTFANGKASSLVLDSGAGVTSVVPVQDGIVLQKAIVKSNLAGNLLTDEYQKLLESRGVKITPHYLIDRKNTNAPEKAEPLGATESYRQWAIKQIVRDLKETVCRLSDNTFDESANTNIPAIPYELPDGHTVDVGPDRFGIPELMFNPSPLNQKYSPAEEYVGVPQMLLNSIGKCDIDIRREFYNSIIVTGGNSLLPGFADRLHKELADRAPPGMYRVKVLASGASTDRKFGVFIGGSILASLGSFQQIWMSKQEYEEHGRTIVESKCP